MKIQRDSKDQPFIEWQQGASGFKRAWIQRKPGTDKDWANANDGRYLNVVRVERRGAGPAGNNKDIPIFSRLRAAQIRFAFIRVAAATTSLNLAPSGSQA